MQSIKPILWFTAMQRKYWTFARFESYSALWATKCSQSSWIAWLVLACMKTEFRGGGCLHDRLWSCFVSASCRAFGVAHHMLAVIWKLLLRTFLTQLKTSVAGFQIHITLHWNTKTQREGHFKLNQKRIWRPL